MCVTNTTLRRLALQPIYLRPSELINNVIQRPLESYSNGSSLAATATPLSIVEETVSSSSAAAVTAPPSEKTRAKRRRKPQKPGLTAKNQERHFVVHNYHDHAVDTPQDVEAHQVSSSDSGSGASERRCGGITMSFPSKLHTVLDQIALDGYDHIISWQPHGRAFAIHQPKVFTEQIMPK
jgi:HSF-type DNA-binding